MTTETIPTVHGDLTQAIMGAMLMGDIEERVGGQLLDVHLRVMQEIICPITGQILDSRTANMWDVTGPDGSERKVVVAPTVDKPTLESALIEGCIVGERFNPLPAWQELVA